MKNKLRCFSILAALCCCFASAAFAEWMDGFESYGLSNPLPAPWENAVSQGANPGSGYSGSYGTYGPNW